MAKKFKKDYEAFYKAHRKHRKYEKSTDWRCHWMSGFFYYRSIFIRTHTYALMVNPNANPNLNLDPKPTESIQHALQRGDAAAETGGRDGGEPHQLPEAVRE